jgi:hypothetical protein
MVDDTRSGKQCLIRAVFVICKPKLMVTAKVLDIAIGIDTTASFGNI